MRKWEGFAFGWCAGVITSVDSAHDRQGQGQLLRALRHGPGGGGRSPFLTCSSSINTRRPTEDAEYNSWLLLEKVELEGEQGGEEGEEEAGVQAKETLE